MGFFTSERKRFRILILPIAAGVIAALCVWKMSQPPSPQIAADQTGIVLRPAPPFAAHDARKPPRLVRLNGSYLGRHRILLVFFDGKEPFDRDPVIQKLTKEFDALESEGIQVFALSAALPQTNRQRMKAIDPNQTRWPFPILSDPTFVTQRKYGRIANSGKSAKPEEQGMYRERSGVFLIDRAGRIPYRGDEPVPLANPLRTIDALASGSDDGL